MTYNVQLHCEYFFFDRKNLQSLIFPAFKGILLHSILPLLKSDCSLSSLFSAIFQNGIKVSGYIFCNHLLFYYIELTLTMCLMKT